MMRGDREARVLVYPKAAIPGMIPKTAHPRAQDTTLKLAFIVLGLSLLPSLFLSMGLLEFNLKLPVISEVFRVTGSDFARMEIVYEAMATSFVSTLLTWSTFCIAIITAALAILHFYIERDAATPIIGIAFFCVAILEAIFTIFSAQLFQYQVGLERMLPALWTSGRLLHAAIMIGGASYVLWRGTKRFEGQISVVLVGCVVFACIAGLVTQTVLPHAEWLPQMIYPDEVVSRPFDLIPLGLYAMAGLLIYPRFHRKVGSTFSLALILSVIPDIVTQIHMAFGSRVLFDDHYIVAGLLKNFAYMIPLVGLMWNYMHTHRKVQDNVAKLEREMEERSRAEANWAESERRLRNFLDNARDLIQITSDAGEFRFVNRAWQKALGYDDDALRKLRLESIVVPGERDLIRDYFHKVLHSREDEDAGEIVVHLLAQDGTEILAEGTANPLYDEDRTPAIYASFRDITERHRALESLRTTQGELDRFFSLSVDMLCIVDCDGVLKRVSPAWTEVLGYQQRELEERRCVELIHPDERAATLRAFSQLQEGTTRVSFECRLIGADGKEKWFNWAACMYPERKLIYAAVRDETERKRFEAELINAKLEADGANQSKSAFLASMSHEIRTPLNAILGMADLLGEADLPADQRKYVDVLKGSGSSLLNLINDILDLSKVEAGQLEIEAIEFELHELVENVAQLLSTRADEKGVQLLVHIERELPQRVVGDPGRLRQILINLIGNAIKFTERGEVCIKAERGKREGDTMQLLFSVADTGIGIPADRIDRVFESFTQADSSVARKYGGTGLGLAISKRLVAMMGGTINAESTVGEGTTFHFSVQIGLPDLESHPSTIKMIMPPPVIRGTRAMIIDDNLTSLKILESLLSELKLDVSLAEDVESAMQTMEAAQQAQKPYKYVLIDSGGVNLHGLGAVGRVRNAQLAEIVMVMVSSHRAHEVKAALRRHPGIIYLIKPIHRGELYRAFATRMERPKRLTSPSSIPHAQPPPPPAAKETKPSMRIMLAEDTEDNRVLFTIYLKSTPHTVDIARNGCEAVDLFRQNHYDLILMDIEMPEMNGYDATAEIRRIEEERLAGEPDREPVPIIALTAHAMNADKEKCLASGFDLFLTKPIRKSALLETINDYQPDAAPPS